MAMINLNPGEKFEHQHHKQSYTELISGKIILRFNLEEISLIKGNKVTIPKNTSHSVENVGKNVAVFACGYGDG